MSILEIAANYYQYFLRGTRTTILVALVTVFCGALLGCAIALMRLSKIKVLNWFSRLYITVIRGTPMLVQLYIVYFQLDFIKYPSGSIFGVNLERAMAAGGRFGGHIVSGHADGTGIIREIRQDDNAVWFTISTSSKLLRYIVEKGSITIDGISLTVDNGWLFCFHHSAYECGDHAGRTKSR